MFFFVLCREKSTSWGLHAPEKRWKEGGLGLKIMICFAFQIENCSIAINFCSLVEDDVSSEIESCEEFFYQKYDYYAYFFTYICSCF